MAQLVSCCAYDKPRKIMQHIHGNMLDCWDNPIVHLLLLKSSMMSQILMNLRQIELTRLPIIHKCQKTLIV